MVPHVQTFLRKLQRGAIFTSTASINTWRANLAIYCVRRYHSERCENYKPNAKDVPKGIADFKAYANPEGQRQVLMRDFVFDRMS